MSHPSFDEILVFVVLSCYATAVCLYLASAYSVYPMGPVLAAGSLTGTGTVSAVNQVLRIGSTGNLYTLDFRKQDIVIASSDGTIIAAFDPLQDLVTTLAMCLDPSNNIWVADLSSSDPRIWGVNVATGAVINSIPAVGITGEANACAVDPIGQNIYACTANGNIYKYPLTSTTGVAIQTITGAALGWCMDLIIDPPTQNIWQTNYYVSS